MPGAPVTVMTMGVRSSTQRSNAATICASSASRPTNGAPPTFSRRPRTGVPDDGAAVAAQLQLVAPARQLRRRRVGEHLPAHGVAREGGGAVDDLAGRPRAVDARPPRRDADGRVELGDPQARGRARAAPRRPAPCARPRCDTMASPPSSVASAPRARRCVSRRARGGPLGTWVATIDVTSRVPPLLPLVVRLAGAASCAPLRVRRSLEWLPELLGDLAQVARDLARPSRGARWGRWRAASP